MLIQDINVVVFSSGKTIYVPVYKASTYCDTHPDDVTPTCSFTYGSWLQNDKETTLEIERHDFEMEHYETNRHYEYLGSEVFLHKRSFDCCPGLFFDEMKYTLHLKKRLNGEKTGSGSSSMSTTQGTVLTLVTISVITIYHMLCFPGST